VTSPHGAAWHDIQNVIARRFPLAHLRLSPATVQGDEAPLSIVRALQSLQEDDHVEVIILARGGGASDDLSAFNDERVVRAVFASRAPVICGIGHATDATLVELVADVCAPTPSAAAEISVPSHVELHGRLRDLRTRLTWAASIQYADAADTARAGISRLAKANPTSDVPDQRARLDALLRHLRRSAYENVDQRRRDVGATGAVLDALDPSAVLRRGYASVCRLSDDQPICDVALVQPGDQVRAVLEHGSLIATVEVRRVHSSRATEALVAK
jgi:exodeoxyribonuclease VII large subunit